MALAGSQSNRPRLPPVPQALPKTQAEWDRVVNVFQQWRSAMLPKWIAPTLQNGWVNYGNDGTYTYNPAGYYMDVSGRVWLRGMLKNGTVNSAFFTLPSGFAPSYRQLFIANSNSGAYRLDIGIDGTVVSVGAPATTWFSLDGISFSTTP